MGHDNLNWRAEEFNGGSGAVCRGGQVRLWSRNGDDTATTVRRRLAPAQPASFVAFGILAVDSVDVRPMR